MAPVRTADKDSQPVAGGSAGGEKQRRKPGRVPVSCAECRRLKLRCDRQVPCESCTKRGCAALCPDGSLPTTKGPKLKAAAEVEELKDKIAQLEAALRQMQAAVSDEPHPLLQDSPGQQPSATPSSSADSGASPPGSSAPSNSSASSQSPKEDTSSEVDEMLDTFGTLTLGNRGEARFFGQTSRTEYLIHAPERLTPFVDKIKLPRLSAVTIDEACKELDVFCTNDTIGEEVVGCIPSMQDALRLCDIYFECSKFMWYPLPREYVYTEVVSAIYQRPTGEYCHVTRKHALSLLFMIFSLATLYDPTMPPYSVEAQEYYLLARIALRWAPPAYDTTLAAIQSLLYMGQYLEMADCEPAHTASHKAWITTRHTVTLGLSIGLHVSSCKWQLDEVAAAKRGRMFWQMFTQDTWLSYGFGRPPSISLAYVECEIPKPEEIGTANGTSWSTDFHVWTWQFTKLLHTIITSAFAAKSPTYTKIMELDKRVRDFPDPDCIQVKTEDVTRTMQHLLVTLYKETTHLNLHRPYLSQALKDSAEDPLRHRYGASVMIIYRSAWRILNAVQSAYRTAPGITARMNLLWSQSLACAILLCLLITRAPASSLAHPALMELDKICELFEEAANQSQIVTNNIQVLRTLRKQAHAAMTKVMAEDAALVASELDRLGGKTQLIQTIGERMMTCHSSLTNRYIDTYFSNSKVPLSVFEVTGNPNGVVAPIVAQDVPVFDDADLLGNPPAFDEFNFDFLSGPAVGCTGTGTGTGTGTQTQSGSRTPGAQSSTQQGHTGDEVDFSQIQNFDWISGYLNATSGVVPQGPQPQTASEPVPNPADTEATWQVLVQQLGVGL
ncbi:hypothetical protein L226DRAFT_528955 [Lentinus tigrinus ALCF2SS1-7]|uniref:Zn(2)-C6 fungal-type domain-containing protein n=1 Tax=Lentinus tigrinus ALCF2SS1-6 TaxID=1328759 RepID=A0A5C2SM33_9APHY|nr:hypothetical protein L227DRAFT_571131 [Lentinus tigrinus ALCF2SS1-6]RPD82829.1 hypothetical protein L226DRAFT_528955 [Lentinus tigrinus ALCF2SS1-7]